MAADVQKAKPSWDTKRIQNVKRRDLGHTQFHVLSHSQCQQLPFGTW